MRKKRRGNGSSSLAFLDVMSCGFGAAVLVFMLVKHNSAELAIADSYGGSGALAGASTVETLEKVIKQMVSDADKAAGESASLQKQLSGKLIAFAQTESKIKNPGDGNLEALKQKLKHKEAALQKAREKGEQRLAIKGAGKRQYLTGLNIKGQRIVILFDRSASMTDDELVNIIRNKYLSESERKKSGKWRWGTAILHWTLAHLPRGAQYQVFSFNDKVTSALPKGWAKVNDRPTLQAALKKIKTWAPENGTDLESAFTTAARMTPRPDAIYLITDGLPTLRPGASQNDLVSGQERFEYFQKAVKRLPQGVAVHTILLPTKGDPLAAGAYWNLAANTGGRFLAPSWDWP